MGAIKRYYVDDPMDNDYELIESVGGDIVLHTDHLASHAFDEAVERAAFEVEYTQPSLIKRNKCGLYQCDSVRYAWHGWEACAKSRAKRAGGE